ncbi:MAG: methyltransferase domain-containing protein [Thaumarchaeota archaeon]|nr:methyltransferase domain-containing protein [Nitrososphaerota archaeon]
MIREPYLASEDSALLRGALSAYSGESCLEIGAGNGGNLLSLSERFDMVVGTDVVRPSMPDWRERGANYVLADGGSCLKDAAFDLVAFNPPYLKTEGAGDVTVEGGDGLEVPKKFLSEALRVVKQTGRIVMLLNDEAEVDAFRRVCAGKGFGLRRIGSKRMFFEELSVYEASSVASPSLA